MHSSSLAARSEQDIAQAGASNKVARACDACYKRKIKCDGGIPGCNWCIHHNMACTFSRPMERKRKAKTQSAESSYLEDRISRIEKLLENKFLGNSTPVTSGSPIPSPRESTPQAFEAPATSSVAMHFAGREFGTVSFISGILFLHPEAKEWIRSRTGQTIMFDKLDPSRLLWEKQRALSSSTLMTQGLDPFELPSQRLVEIYFDIYTSSFMVAVFPIVDPILFRRTIDLVYNPQNSNPACVPASARACIFAFLAWASCLIPPGGNQTPPNTPQVNSESMARKAQILLPQVLPEPASLESLQTTAMLGHFDLVSGNLRSANYFLSVSARMIFMLGAHTVPGKSPSLSTAANDHDARLQEHLRNIFWMCYITEKDVSLQTGQPPVLSDEDCDLALPPGHVEQLYERMALKDIGLHVAGMPTFPLDLRLGIIKSRVYSTLYSFKGLKKTDADLLKEIRELDDELERWRLSIPLEWRPTLSFSHETPQHFVHMGTIMLRLNYHLCMIIIHQASSRCKAWANGEAGTMEGVSSSLALSVEASRSTLLYLTTAKDALADGAFWALLFYPISALLVIFCNILQNPSDPQATKDLVLLSSATGMMEQVFLRQLSSATEVVHIQLVAEFVTELHRLAQCAIDQA